MSLLLALFSKKKQKKKTYATLDIRQHKSPIVMAHTVSMSGPWVPLIHSLIDNLCSRPECVHLRRLCRLLLAAICFLQTELTCPLGLVYCCVLTGNQLNHSITPGHYHKVTHTQIYTHIRDGAVGALNVRPERLHCSS